MPYDDLMADNNADLAEDLQTDGNSPPYNATTAGEGNAWVKIGEIGSTASGQKLSTGYFDAPCGFVLIYVGVASPPVLSDLAVTFASGDYKGVHAPSMLE